MKTIRLASQRAVSLVELLVVTALLGLVMLGVLDAGLLSSKGNQSTMVSAEFNDVISLVVAILGHTDSCNAAFASLKGFALTLPYSVPQLTGSGGNVLVASGLTPSGLNLSIQLVAPVLTLTTSGSGTLGLYDLQVTGTKPAGTFGGATQFTKNFWVPFWMNPLTGQFLYCN